MAVEPNRSECSKCQCLWRLPALPQSRRASNYASKLPALHGTTTGRPATREVTKPPPLRWDAPMWWNPAPAIHEAADSFDAKYARVRQKASKALRTLSESHGTSSKAERDFSAQLSTLQRSRFSIQPLRSFAPRARNQASGVKADLELSLASTASGPWLVCEDELPADDAMRDEAEALPQSVLQSPARTRKPRWRLVDSVWLPRKKGGNSLSFFETEAGLRKM